MLELSNNLRTLVASSERDFAALTGDAVSSPRIAGGWSRKQILGHLIDSASNNHQRFVRALLQDEYRGPGYDQTGCVRVQDYQAIPWGELVQLWASYNRLLAHIIAGFPEEKLGTPCFVGDNSAMTLEELAVDYVRHLKHHLTQLRD